LPPRSSYPKILHYVFLLLLSLLALSLYTTGLTRSLWLDEAWVANSLLQPTLSSTLFYPGWLQSSPPGFLTLARIPLALLPASERTLRLVPFAMTLLGLITSYLLFRRHLPRYWALSAFAFLCFAPPVIFFARELKQYSTEMAVSALLLLLTSRYLAQPNQRRFIYLLSASLAGICFAFSTAFFLPGIAAAILFARPLGSRQSRSRVLLYCASTALCLALLYSFYIQPNTQPALKQFFVSMEPPLSLWQTIRTRGPLVLAVLPLPGEELLPTPITKSLRFTALFFPFVLFLLRRRLQPLLFPLACLLPGLLLFAAHYLGLYPLQNRLLLTLLPGFILLPFLGIQLASLYIPRTARQALIPLAILLCFLPLGKIFIESPWDSLSQPIEDNAGAITYLAERLQPGEALYVHASLREPFLLYTRLPKILKLPARFGTTSPPCCPRGVPFSGGQARIESALADFHRLMGPRLPSRFWMLFTQRPEHWFYSGLDEPRVIFDDLENRACQLAQPQLFSGVLLISADCPPSP